MTITGIVPQLRTTDMASSIRFHTEKLGFCDQLRSPPDGVNPLAWPVPATNTLSTTGFGSDST